MGADRPQDTDKEPSVRRLSEDLKPGMRLRHSDGEEVTLARRKQPSDKHHGLPFHPGWWLVEGGGLADMVIDSSDSGWEVVGDYAALEDAISRAQPDLKPLMAKMTHLLMDAYEEGFHFGLIVAGLQAKFKTQGPGGEQ